MQKTITGTVPAYLHKASGINPAELSADAERAAEEQKNRLVSRICYDAGDWIKEDGSFLPIGTAEITITLHDTMTMVRGQVAALQKEKSKVMAEAQRKAMDIEDQISKLQALTFEG